MRFDNIIPFTYQRYAIKNTIDIRTVYEQNDHEYVIGTVPLKKLPVNKSSTIVAVIQEYMIKISVPVSIVFIFKVALCLM